MTNAGTTFRALVRDAAKLNRAGVELGFAARCTVGVAIPLIVAAVSGNALAGVSAAYGALVAGMASRQGVYRSRAVGMLLTALALGVSGSVGALTASVPVLNVALAGILAATLGLLAAIGRAATTVSINAVVAFVLFSNPPYDGSDPLFEGAMVFVGGALQTLLLVLVWPLQRFSRERGALAGAYRALASYARSVTVDDLGFPDPASLVEVRRSLADPQPFGNRNELASFETLADEAERLRTTLAALTSDVHLLADVGASAAATAIGKVAVAAGDVLEALAHALDRGTVPATAATLDAYLAAARASEAVLAPGTPAIEDARKLGGQLRAAWRSATVAANGGGEQPDEARPSRIASSGIADALDTIRANLSLDSMYARHAIRYGVAIALGITAQHLLDVAHGQWIGLTIAIVLQPDFSSTFRRGIARVGGTIGGAVLASVVAAFHPAPSLYVVLAIAFAASAFALFNVSYAVFSAAITGYVVYLLAFGGAPEHRSAFERVVATLIGGMIALIAYVVWPTWARERVGEDLAALLDAQRRYGRLILSGFLEPEQIDRDAIRAEQLASRRARSNAEASVDQMKGEPVGGRDLTLAQAQGVLAATRRIGVAHLTLSSRLGMRDDASRDRLGALIDDLDRTFALLEDALRAGTPPAPLPPLRDRQTMLARALAAEPDAHWEVLIGETDVLVDALDSIHAIVLGR